LLDKGSGIEKGIGQQFLPFARFKPFQIMPLWVSSGESLGRFTDEIVKAVFMAATFRTLPRDHGLPSLIAASCGMAA
jgi:hypothetical protein